MMQLPDLSSLPTISNDDLSLIKVFLDSEFKVEADRRAVEDLIIARLPDASRVANPAAGYERGTLPLVLFEGQFERLGPIDRMNAIVTKTLGSDLLTQLQDKSVDIPELVARNHFLRNDSAPAAVGDFQDRLHWAALDSEVRAKKIDPAEAYRTQTMMGVERATFDLFAKYDDIFGSLDVPGTQQKIRESLEDARRRFETRFPLSHFAEHKDRLIREIAPLALGKKIFELNSARAVVTLDNILDVERHKPMLKEEGIDLEDLERKVLAAGSFGSAMGAMVKIQDAFGATDPTSPDFKTKDIRACAVYRLLAENRLPVPGYVSRRELSVLDGIAPQVYAHSTEVAAGHAIRLSEGRSVAISENARQQLAIDLMAKGAVFYNGDPVTANHLARSLAHFACYDAAQAQIHDRAPDDHLPSFRSFRLQGVDKVQFAPDPETCLPDTSSRLVVDADLSGIALQQVTQELNMPVQFASEGVEPQGNVGGRYRPASIVEALAIVDAGMAAADKLMNEAGYPAQDMRRLSVFNKGIEYGLSLSKGHGSGLPVLGVQMRHLEVMHAFVTKGHHLAGHINPANAIQILDSFATKQISSDIEAVGAIKMMINEGTRLDAKEFANHPVTTDPNVAADIIYKALREESMARTFEYRGMYRRDTAAPWAADFANASLKAKHPELAAMQDILAVQSAQKAAASEVKPSMFGPKKEPVVMKRGPIAEFFAPFNDADNHNPAPAPYRGPSSISRLSSWIKKSLASEQDQDASSKSRPPGP